MQDQPLPMVSTPDLTTNSIGSTQTVVVEDLGLASINYWMEQPVEIAIDAFRQIHRQRRVVANQSLETPANC